VSVFLCAPLCPLWFTVCVGHLIRVSLATDPAFVKVFVFAESMSPDDVGMKASAKLKVQQLASSIPKKTSCTRQRGLKESTASKNCVRAWWPTLHASPGRKGGRRKRFASGMLRNGLSDQFPDLTLLRGSNSLGSGGFQVHLALQDFLQPIQPYRFGLPFVPKFLHSRLVPSQWRAFVAIDFTIHDSLPT
jgi:hypothetical protein